MASYCKLDLDSNSSPDQTPGPRCQQKRTANWNTQMTLLATIQVPSVELFVSIIYGFTEPMFCPWMCKKQNNKKNYRFISLTFFMDLKIKPARSKADDLAACRQNWQILLSLHLVSPHGKGLVGDKGEERIGGWNRSLQRFLSSCLLTRLACWELDLLPIHCCKYEFLRNLSLHSCPKRSCWHCGGQTIAQG